MIQIQDTLIGPGQPVWIIAELSANHNGSLSTALETVRAAHRAGADAIKIQTYTADTITLPLSLPDFTIKGTLWEGRQLYDLYQEAYTPWEWHQAIFDEAHALGLMCFSSPFDRTAVDFLETLSCPVYKIASFEITDTDLIAYVASKGKPMIISTGIAEASDIELALDTCKQQGNDQIVLLKCTSSYPAPLQEAQLCMIPAFAERFGVVTGLSDHTLGITAPVVATALGAAVIEKHLILHRDLGGPDAAFSLTEAEFTQMVSAVREAQAAVGQVDYELTPKQRDGRQFSRSLYVAADIQQGEVFTRDNVRSVRPGYGLHPQYLPQILGKKAKTDVTMGTRMSMDFVES